MFKLVVLSCIVAMASAGAIGPLGIAGLGWGAHLAAPLAAPLVAPLAAAPIAWGAGLGHGAYNYRGPVSLAPGQPASILAADGRPLDTLSVNLDRAAHYTARAVDHAGLHLLKKRSVPLLAGLGGPVAVSHSARIDIPAARLGWPAAVAPVGVGAWGHAAAPLGAWGPAAAPLGAWAHGAALGHLW